MKTAPLSLFKKTSIVLSVAIFVMLIVGLSRLPATITRYTIAYYVGGVLALGYSIVSVIKENLVLKIIQVVVTYLMGAVACIIEPTTFDCIGIWSLCLFLLYGYNWVQGRFKLLLGIYFSSTLGIYTIAVLLKKDFELINIVYLATFYIVHVLILFHVFDEKIKETAAVAKSKEAAASLGERILILVHDTKNLLHKISSSLYMLRRSDTTPEEAEQYSSIMSRSLESAANQFEALLSVQKKTEAAEFKLKDVCTSIVYLYQLSSRKTVTFNTTSVEDLLCIGDHLEFLSLLDNIVKNSIEAGGTEITMTASREKHEILFSVTDNAGGIPKCTGCRQQGMCLSCTKLSSTKKTGHGIGIQSIQHTIKSFNGHLRVVSTNSKGTTFLIRIPG